MKKRKIAAISFVVALVIGFVIPEDKVIPVLGANSNDWNKDTYWYSPWGKSGVHKGIDIFAAKNTPVIATTSMIILYQGQLKRGGNIVVGLGPKWRLHYYAHLSSTVSDSVFKSPGDKIGEVGNTGNALNKPSHLHYSVVSLIPRFWAIDRSQQGYKKAFYINPITYLADK